MPNGQPEIFASIQGEGVSVGTPSIFVRLAECNLRCEWCFVPDTPVLMADWSWKRLDSVVPGDQVVGISGATQHGKHRKLAVATVTRVGRRFAQTVVVNDVLRCTPDHKFWLTGKDQHGRSTVHSGWREVARAVGFCALYTTEPTYLDKANYQRGWLAGIADGDGCFWTLKFRRGYRRFRLAVNDHPLLERARTYAANAGYDLRPGTHQHSGFKGLGTMPCLWMTADATAREFESWLGSDVEDPSWYAGYLGGILDAEGSHSQGVLRIAQDEVNAKTRSRIANVLVKLSVPFTLEESGFYLHRKKGGAWRALSLARPAKERLVAEAFGHHPHASRVIESVVPTDTTEEVVTMTTSTGSFVAGGYVVKNCDTKYTWDWANYDRDTQVLELDTAQVAAAIVAANVENIVVTGGEPLLQQDELVPLLRDLRARGKRVEIETSGTIAPSEDLAPLVDQWNVSPKLEHSGNHLRARLRSGPLAWFADASNAYFKFVVVSPTDLDEIERVVTDFKISRDRVLLMPEGTDPETLAERGRWLADCCSSHGFRLGTRLHVFLWGAARAR